MLRTGFVYNETKREYLACLQHYNELKNSFRTDRSLEAKLMAAGRSLELAGKNMKRWEARWIKTRRGVSFFFHIFFLCECGCIG